MLIFVSRTPRVGWGPHQGVMLYVSFTYYSRSTPHSRTYTSTVSFILLSLSVPLKTPQTSQTYVSSSFQLHPMRQTRAIVVYIVVDGCKKVHPRVLDCLTLLGVHQHGDFTQSTGSLVLTPLRSDSIPTFGSCTRIKESYPRG